jgi:DNA-binding CsgD family transcriptional regulator
MTWTLRDRRFLSESQAGRPRRGRRESCSSLATRISSSPPASPLSADSATPLSARELAPSARASASTAEPVAEPLSASETRVIRYRATNLTMKEVANEPCVSTNTVKTHVRHVYAKLDVNGRSDAVERLAP